MDDINKTELKKKKRKLKKSTKIILGIIIFLVVAGGVTAAVLLLPKKKTEPKKDDKTQEVEKQPAKVNIVDVNSKSRPYAVMINNIGAARPYQSGLQDAYIMYEFIVEGGITRYLALFKDANVNRIGTIRSSRHYYLVYVLENDAIYVHWGGSEFAYADISSLGIDNIDGMIYGGNYLWKDTSLPVSTEHTAYSGTDKINEAVDNLGYRKETDKGLLLKYSPTSLDLAKDETAKDATSIDIVYSNAIEDHYDYDEYLRVYKRSVNGEPHVDYMTGEQYTFKNIITYQVPNETIAGDYKGRQNLYNTGSGEGYYISEGKAIEITWEKPSRGAKTVYKVKSTGEELVVNDGNTFIQVQPVGETLTIS